MNAFDTIARRYARDAAVQLTAGERLLALLRVRPDADVLDLGCGPGHLTRRLRELTAGRILGVDPSAGMVAEARRRFGGDGIDFAVGAAEHLPAADAFDAIFCNSALQWFRDPARALRACAQALRAGGAIAVQAPAGREYCPNFLAAVDALARDPRTAATFRAFRPPWFYRPEAADYAALATAAGLAVDLCRIEREATRMRAAEVVRVFESGAAAGYLDPACYGAPWPPAYEATARAVLAAALRSQAGADGTVELVFHRLYLLAHKPGAAPRGAPAADWR